ncbi:hypothetical protein A8B84_10740 [Marinobacter sp. EhC06]|jgi:hypothetical protein|uniref:hypothetical protein n=1 Tax=Marinobacter TaxID=2742 RepID=UPI0007D8EC85|nr:MULTISPECIES: hypothetical protein [unclassified Marinobacter]OAN89044.1 hypothetical protein A8B80_08945 [Marinobacter sp. EhN04]OAN92027.1 hypothetical protein A8B84_10740 [Marinobacter sp. EhC06]
MIHPTALVFAIIVIMAGLFALLYLAIHIYTRSEERRLQLEQNRYDTSVEVKAGTDYSVRFRPGVNSDTPASAYLSACNPPSYSVRVATMRSPTRVILELDAQAFDDIAIAWIEYRGLAGAVGGPPAMEC